MARGMSGFTFAFLSCCFVLISLGFETESHCIAMAGLELIDSLASASEGWN